MTHKTWLESLEFVADNSQYVSIDQKAIDDFVGDFKPTKAAHWKDLYPIRYKRRQKDEEELDFLFLLALQAYCFWGYPTKWTINFKDQKLDGWWALIASTERALEEGKPLTDGNYLASLGLQATKEIFRGQPEIPLLDKRHQLFIRAGKVLKEKFGGHFYNWYKQAPRQAIDLTQEIANTFFGFDDHPMYKGKRVYFFKKAQLLVHDIHTLISNKVYGQIKNMDHLPGTADYKIPAIMRKLGIVNYTKTLSNLVDNRQEIPFESEMEIEIRANMLWATHLIHKKLKHRYPKVTPALINYILWNQSQEKHPEDKPYHLTKTIYY